MRLTSKDRRHVHVNSGQRCLDWDWTGTETGTETGPWPQQSIFWMRNVALHCGSLWSSLPTSGFLDNVSWQLSCCLALFVVVAVAVVNCAAIKGRRRHIKILKCFLPPPQLLPPTINGRGSVAATDRKCQRAFLFFRFLFLGQLQSYPKAITMLPVRGCHWKIRGSMGECEGGGTSRRQGIWCRCIAIVSTKKGKSLKEKNPFASLTELVAYPSPLSLSLSSRPSPL